MLAGQAGFEVCDDGNARDDDACLTAASARCGDGILRTDLAENQVGYEACDDGNQLNHDDCDNECQIRVTDGSSPDRAAQSCRVLHEQHPELPSALYWIDFDADGPNTALRHYCDMAWRDGGWTLIVNRRNGGYGSRWGTTHVQRNQPGIDRDYILDFVTQVPTATEVGMRYLTNGSGFTHAFDGDWTWRNNRALRRQVADGRYLIFASSSDRRDNYCVVSGRYDNGYTCDGDRGQIAGQGFFEDNAANEFCNCRGHGWKSQAGGCQAQVCEPGGYVSVWLR